MKAPSPPAWFFGCLVAMEGLHVLAPGPRWLAQPWTLVGVLPLGAGIALHSWATSVFHRAGTTLDPDGRPATLVCVGPYARTRNPMYLAGLPILIGVALLLGSTSPLSILLLFAACASRWVGREEGALRARFGSEWDDYSGTVRRWL